MTTGNDVLMGGGGSPVAKFDTIGTTIAGRVVAPPEAYQVTDYQTKTPKTYPSGDPIMGVRVELQTDQRDPSVEDDDGRRRLFLDGKRIKEAVRDAIFAAGRQGLEVGGLLSVTYTGDGTPPNRGLSAPKLFTAAYTPPAVQQAAQALGTQSPAAAQPPVAQSPAPAVPAPQPAAAPPPPTVDQQALAAALQALGPEALAALQAQQAMQAPAG